MAAGEHEIEILAVHPPVRGSDGELLDPLYEPVPAFYAWTVVDRTAPDTAILYGPPDPTAGIDAYFGFAASEGNATFECSLDFEGFGGCEPHEVFTDLLPGEHVLHVRAVDAALNADQSPAIHRWTVARQRPEHAGRQQRDGRARRAAGRRLPPAVPGDRQLLRGQDRGRDDAREARRRAAGRPPGYGLVGGRYYDINTTADYGDPLRLCLPYDPAQFDEAPARLLEHNGSEWTDITHVQRPDSRAGCAASRRTSACSRSPPASTCRRSR